MNLMNSLRALTPLRTCVRMYVCCTCVRERMCVSVYVWCMCVCGFFCFVFFFGVVCFSIVGLCEIPNKIISAFKDENRKGKQLRLHSP